MQRYLRRNRLSEAVDSVGLCLLMYLLALGWFSWLWGVGTASLLAGAALGTLLWTARAQWRRRTVSRREKTLRSRLGAELMLESMLMAEPKEAHFCAALLLAEKWPIILQAVKPEGVLCRQGEETLLVRCIRLPEDGELGVGELLSAQRDAKRLKADRAVLCVLGKISAKTAARAEQALVPLRLIRRETLLALAGRYAPATDEQLIDLGRRKRRTAGKGHLVPLILSPDKGPRYHLYGTGMLLLYILTGVRLYAVPGMLCLTLSVLCRWRRRAPELL